ncbi:hypothetical protein SLOPH_1664 [Spraguea lophii 42_110]|uniref:Uncharacterized protein n=1 Tax=Spraguea lophii (strain 42_110) TaxID=1358809 RepID=S7WBB3_SPRLO|nr:hypothetical protein SLOPH_1664 [Spraguea lophii 42_110]
MDEKNIEKEIQEFLSIENKSTDVNISQENIKSNELDRLIGLLTKLEEYYKQINNNLEKAEYEELKRNNLKEMIESTLICDSIMKVLKEVSIERNMAVEAERKTKASVNDLEKGKIDNERKFIKVEADLKYMKNANGELLRLIQDQKQKLSDFKHKSEYEKKSLDDIKILNTELEALRKKALNKVTIMEREKEILEEQILEKDKKLKEIEDELKHREHEHKNKNNTQLILEKKIEELRKTIDMKNSSLSLCNDELSKLLSKEKRTSSELQNVKEKSTYYEKLYHSLSKQNEYLNSQLSRMINTDNIDNLKTFEDKEETDKTQESILKYKKTKKKLKKKENQYLNNLRIKENQIEDLLEKLKIKEKEVELIKEEIIETRAENNKGKYQNPKIFSQMEQLLQKNKEYEKRIKELEEGKEEVFYDVHSTKIEESEEKNRHNKLDTDYQYYLDNRNYNKNTELKTYPSFYTNEKFLKKKIERETKTEPKIQSNIDSFWKRYTESKEQSKSKMNFNNEQSQKINYSKSKTETNNKIIPSENKVEFYNDHKIETKEESDEKDSNSTSSTLKQMKKRTELLQSKFDKLNIKLDEIKNKDTTEPEKIKDQIKEYTNYYYSDFLDVSNDSDFI